MNSIERISEEVFKRIREVEKQLGEKQRIEKEIKVKEDLIDDLRNKRKIYVQAKRVLELAYEKLRRETMSGIERLVNKALEPIYKDLSFRIELEDKRNRNTARFVVKNLSENLIFEGNPLDIHGGSVSQIISLALRISILEKSINPRLEGPLILDEPLTFLDEKSKRAMVEFLRKVSEVLKRQIILITHDRILMEAGDKIFYVEMKNGESSVREIEDEENIKEI